MSNQADTVAERLGIFKIQEELAIFDSFTEMDAFRLGILLHEIASQQKAPVVIDIRTADRILFHAALPGSAPDNDRWVERKANVTLQYHQSSLRVGETLASKGRHVGPDIGLDPLLFAAHGGSFPIRLNHAGVIAAVTVSGLPSAEDHRMIITALSHFLSLKLPFV